MNYDEQKTSSEIIISIDREVAHVKDLEEVNHKHHQGEHLLLNDATTFEFSIVYERQVILLYPIFESEEEADEETDKRVCSTKDDSQSKNDDCM